MNESTYKEGVYYHTTMVGSSQKQAFGEYESDTLAIEAVRIHNGMKRPKQFESLKIIQLFQYKEGEFRVVWRRVP
jgi:hypothetical protein